MTATTDFDSHKDFISRLSLKPVRFAIFSVAAGLSYYNGGLCKNFEFLYQVNSNNGNNVFTVHSSISNLGKIAPRKYKRVYLQIKWKPASKSLTELRAEYWQGKQKATAGSSETPANLPNEPYYIRTFDGAFFLPASQF